MQPHSDPALESGPSLPLPKVPKPVDSRTKTASNLPLPVAWTTEAAEEAAILANLSPDRQVGRADHAARAGATAGVGLGAGAGVTLPVGARRVRPTSGAESSRKKRRGSMASRGHGRAGVSGIERGARVRPGGEVRGTKNGTGRGRRRERRRDIKRGRGQSGRGMMGVCLLAWVRVGGAKMMMERIGSLGESQYRNESELPLILQET